MRKVHLAFAAVVAVCSIPVAAHTVDSVSCKAQQLTEVRSIALLPKGLQAQLGYDQTGSMSIADRGAEFNPTDVNNELPMQRFVLADVGSTCALGAVEQGGRAHFFQLRVFVRTDSEWKELRRKSLREEPRSANDLVSSASK